MGPGIRRAIRQHLRRFPELLSRLGIIDRDRGVAVFDLALPAMVTAGIWTVQRVVDFFMVSVALSDTAVAGLAFAFEYYFIGFSIAIGLSSGTISLVSRFKGAGDDATADLVVKQSLWLGLVLALPMTAAAWFAATPLIDLLTDDPGVVEQGSIYLRIVMLALLFRFWAMVGSQGLNGSGDTRTPMYIISVTVPLNAVLNALLIFGLGPFPELGIAGAAWGTVAANVVNVVLYAGVYLSGRFPVRVRLGRPHWNTGIARELVRVGLPLAATRLVDTLGRFPFLFVLGVLGTPVVAAFAIGRRVVQLAMIPSWGYATAASTFVGQHLGAEDEGSATDYGWDCLRIALATQLLIAGLVAALARPIVELFNTATVGLSVQFVWVFALGIAASSTYTTLQGGLRGAGDTSWPLYGTVLGTVLRLAVAALALPVGFAVGVGSLQVSPGLGLGLLAVYLAILVDWHARAAVNVARFRSGVWRTVARRSAERAETGD